MFFHAFSFSVSYVIFCDGRTQCTWSDGKYPGINNEAKTSKQVLFLREKIIFRGIFIDCVENQLLGFLKTEIAPM